MAKKITRKALFIILGVTAGVFFLYAAVHAIFGFSIGADAEKWLYDTLVIVALGVFVANRKLASDEKKEADAKKGAEKTDDNIDNLNRKGEKGK
jgi:hypothetical protein